MNKRTRYSSRQGRTYADALRVIEEAEALEKAGCFALLLECVPSPIAAAVTKAVSIPTIGIGAGPHVSGQVLVYHDLLGMMQHPHHAKVETVDEYPSISE